MRRQLKHALAMTLYVILFFAIICLLPKHKLGVDADLSELVNANVQSKLELAIDDDFLYKRFYIYSFSLSKISHSATE